MKSSSAPGKKRTTLASQTKHIIKLLMLWPDCPTFSIEQYVEDTLKTTCSRVCIQDAKLALGIKEPAYTPKTMEKRIFVGRITMVIVKDYPALTEREIISRVGRYLKEAYNELTNHRLVTVWVKEKLSWLKDIRSPLDDLAEQARSQLKESGILEKASRQLEII